MIKSIALIICNSFEKLNEWKSPAENLNAISNPSHEDGNNIKLKNKIISCLPCIYVLFSVLCSGCSIYSLSTLDKGEYRDYLDEIQDTNNYVIVHSPDTAFHFKNIKYDAYYNQKEIIRELSGELEFVIKSHQFYKLENKKLRHQHIKKYGRPNNDIHLYIKDSLAISGVGLTLSLMEIKEIKIYTGDAGSTNSTVGISVAVGLGFALFIGLIVAFGGGYGMPQW